MKKTLQELLRALRDNLPDIPFEVYFWDGDAELFGNGRPAFTVTLKSEQAVKAVFNRGPMGFREEYVAGTIDVAGDLQQLFRVGMDPRVQDMKLSLRTKAAVLLQHLKSLNTLKRSPGNIAHHYGLGDHFYKLYLDESLTYSCAYFKNAEDTLEQAQQQKYEHICRKLHLKEGDTLVDIGCGWGGMLLYAARHYGIKGLGCTLSDHQAEYARKKVVQDGLEKRISILLEDYRKITGQFDKFVSIGMFEHVGKGFIPMFMEKMKSLLKPNGIGLLHTIGKECDTAGDPWTMKYIFPGAYVPVLDHVIRSMGEKGLVPVDIENLRVHYALTLDEWGRRLETNKTEIETMFDRKIVRMWRMYLNGSAAAFRWGDIRLYQILCTNGPNNALPLTREHLYRT
jgi:cyclopropane-fatty-acyl-phospholipid synthase